MSLKSKEIFCNNCNMSFSNELDLFKHSHTLFHHKNVEKANEASRKPSHACTACDISHMTLSEFVKHVGTRAHQDELNKAISRQLEEKEKDSASESESTTTKVTSATSSFLATERDPFARPQVPHKRRSNDSPSEHETSSSNSTKERDADHPGEWRGRFKSSSASAFRNPLSPVEPRRDPPEHPRNDRYHFYSVSTAHSTTSSSAYENEREKHHTQRILQECKATLNQSRAQRVAMQAKHQRNYFNTVARPPPPATMSMPIMDPSYFSTHPPPPLDMFRYPPPPPHHFPPYGNMTPVNYPPPSFPPPSLPAQPPQLQEPLPHPPPAPVPQSSSSLIKPAASEPTETIATTTTSSTKSASQPSQASPQSRRVAPLSMSAVQRLKKNENAVGKWLQESGAPRVDSSVAADTEVQQLLSSLLAKKKSSSSASSSVHIPMTSSEKVVPKSGGSSVHSTTSSSSKSKKTPTSTSSKSTVSRPSSERKKSKPTVDRRDQVAFIAVKPSEPPKQPASIQKVTSTSSVTPVTKVVQSVLVSQIRVKAEPTVESSEMADDMCTLVTSLPTTERHLDMMDMGTGRIEENTARSSTASMPSPQAKKIRLETQPPAYEAESAPGGGVTATQDVEVATLMRAIELKRDENRITKALDEQLSRIAQLEAQLQQARELAAKLREERRSVRQTKARLCSEVCTRRFSDDEDNEAESGPPTNSSVPSSRSASDRQPPRLVSLEPQTGGILGARFSRQDSESEVTCTSRSSSGPSSSTRHLDTVIPALGNETVREIIQRVMATEEDVPESMHGLGEGFTTHSGHEDLNWRHLTANQQQQHHKEGTLSNISSIAEGGVSDYDDTPRDVVGSVVSDVISMEANGFAGGLQSPRGSLRSLPQHTSATVVKKELVSATKRAQSVEDIRHSNVDNSGMNALAMSEKIFPGEIIAHFGSPILNVFIHEEHIFTCSQDATVKKFNLRTHELVLTLHGHEDAVSCLGLTTRPKSIERVFTGGYDKRMLVFGGKSGRELQRLHFDERILCLTFGGDFVFLGLANGEVVQFNVVKNRVTHRWPTHLGCGTVSGVGVSSVLCGREGARLVLFVGCENGLVAVRDAENGLMLQALHGHPVGTGTVHSLGVLGHRLYSAAEKTLFIHDFTSAAPLQSMLRAEGITAMSVSGQHLVLASNDGAMRVFEMVGNMPRTTDQVRTLYGTKRISVTCVKLVGNMIVAGSREGELLILRLSESNFRCQFGVCKDNFSSRDDLIYHVVKDHVVQHCSNAGGKTVPCGWPGCHYQFHEKLGIKVIEEHVDTHVK